MSGTGISLFQVKHNLIFSLSPAAFCFPETSNIPATVKFRTKCRRSSGEPQDDGKASSMSISISNLVGESVEELLNLEENRRLLDKLNDATERVERARLELANFQRQEVEARQIKQYIQNMEAYAAEISECQREVFKARAIMQEAELELAMKMNTNTNTGNKKKKDDERFESVKAASISALVGSLAGLPVSLAQPTTITIPLLPLATTFASCALFGITFRYVVRRNLDDIHLKNGAALAFGVVRGLARLGAPTLELNNTDAFLSYCIDAVVLVSQDVFIFLFAAVGLDLCFKLRLLSPFPIARPPSTR